MQKLLIILLFICSLIKAQIVDGEGQVVFMIDNEDSIYFDHFLDTFHMNTNHNAIMNTDLIESYSTNEILTIYTQYNNSFPDLPEVGELCKKDSIYIYNDTAIFCIQTHNRTIYHPNQTPALFRVYREDTGDLDWIVNERVNIDNIRVYLGISYKCFQLHTTEVGREPTNTLGVLWTKVATDSLWHEGIEYTITEDTVWYSDISYVCIQSHISQIGWEPPNVLSLWNEIIPPSTEWQDGYSYKIDDIVTYNGTEYICIQAHTSNIGWIPPNVLGVLWNEN